MLLVHLIISFMGIMDQEFKSWFYIPSKSYDGKIYTLTQFLEYGLFQVANLWCFCNPDQHTITGNFFYNQPCHIKVQTIFFFLSSLRPCCFMLVNLNCSFGKLSMKRLIFLHFAANSPPPQKNALFYLYCLFCFSWATRTPTRPQTRWQRSCSKKTGASTKREWRPVLNSPGPTTRQADNTYVDDSLITVFLQLTFLWFNHGIILVM